jgi:hypothetical protein
MAASTNFLRMEGEAMGENGVIERKPWYRHKRVPVGWAKPGHRKTRCGASPFLQQRRFAPGDGRLGFTQPTSFQHGEL